MQPLHGSPRAGRSKGSQSAGQLNAEQGRVVRNAFLSATPQGRTVLGFNMWPQVGELYWGVQLHL